MARSGSSQPRCEGGVEHGVFAGDLVGADGEIEALAGGADDVEVGHGGLHQEHVGAFGDVEVDLAHGFAEIGAVHLVAAAVAELRRGVGGLAEGAVEGGGEFRGVAEDGRVGGGAASSSAARMAATRPSIMSLGATMSAPAWASETAVRASRARVESLSMSIVVAVAVTTMPQWPCEVYSQRQTSAMRTSGSQRGWP